MEEPNHWVEMVFIIDGQIRPSVNEWLSSLESDPETSFVGDVIVTPIGSDHRMLHVLACIVPRPQPPAPRQAGDVA